MISMSSIELPTVTLVDVDGTVSNTREHMLGYNSRLAKAFPEISLEYLEGLGAARAAYRNDNSNLTHSQQSEKWRLDKPGHSFDSQTSFMEATNSELFTPELMRSIREWGANPDNFGHGEYEDVAYFINAINTLGSLAVIFTLGSREHASDEPGWQERKILSAPNLAHLPRHVAETLPEGGKGEVIAKWYNHSNNTFLIPRTDGGAPVLAQGAVMVDDVMHNLTRLPDQALGVLVDRDNKHTESNVPAGIKIVRSLRDVPALVKQYDAFRRDPQ